MGGLGLVLSMDECFSQNARLERFEGGNIVINGELRSTLLTGPGVLGTTYGLTAPGVCDPFIVFGNPAALGNLSIPGITLPSSHSEASGTALRGAVSLAPPLGITVTRFTDLSGSVQTAVDEATDGFELATTKIYPELEVHAERTGAAVSGFAGAIGWAPGEAPLLFIDRLGFGYNQALHLRLRTLYSGMRMRLRTIEERPEEEIVMLASMGMDGDITLESHQWTVGGAHQWGTGAWTGLALQLNQLALKGYFFQQSEGILSMAGNSSAFNDPNDPWENRLKSDVSVNWSGRSPALRIGHLQSLTSRLSLGGYLLLQSPITLDGENRFELFRFPPLNLNPQEGEDQFDVNLIDPAEKTRTERRDISPHQIEILLPQQLSIGVSARTLFRPHLVYTLYWGELGWRAEMMESGVKREFKRGVHPQWGTHLGLDLFLFNLGVGAVSFYDINQGYRDSQGNLIKDKNRFILPHLTLNFQTSLTQNLTLHTSVIGLPEDALRLSLDFNL